MDVDVVQVFVLIMQLSYAEHLRISINIIVQIVGIVLAHAMQFIRVSDVYSHFQVN